jgi:hypothetical protein
VCVLMAFSHLHRQHASSCWAVHKVTSLDCQTSQLLVVLMPDPGGTLKPGSTGTHMYSSGVMNSDHVMNCRQCTSISEVVRNGQQSA